MRNKMNREETTMNQNLTIYYKKSDDETYKMWGWAPDEAQATEVITWLYQDGFDAYWQ